MKRTVFLWYTALLACSPAHAQEVLGPVVEGIDKIQFTLVAVSLSVITIAFIFCGFQWMRGRGLESFFNVFLGGLIVGFAGVFASWVMG